MQKSQHDSEFIAEVRRLHGEGLSRSAIAKALDASTTLIANVARNENLSFDRNRMQAAVQAKQVDNRLRRQRIIDGLYTEAEANLQRLRDATGYTHRVSAGPSSFVVTDTVPNADEVRNHMQAVYSALASAAKLEAIDVDPGVDVARSTLLAIGVALGLPKREHPTA